MIPRGCGKGDAASHFGGPWESGSITPVSSPGGTLKIGMLADFIALSDDLYEIEPERIAEQYVTTTVVGGEVVFER